MKYTRLGHRIVVSAAVLATLLVGACGTTDSTSKAPAMAALNGHELQDPEVYVNEDDQTVAEFSALPGDSGASLAMLAERFNVVGCEFDSEQNLTSATIWLSDTSNVDWESAVLDELVLAPGSTIASWIEGEGPSPTGDCQLHVSISPGSTITMSCSGACPPDFPICSLVVLPLPDGSTRIVGVTR